MSSIILIRHGESQTNAGEIVHQSIGDHKISLTDDGKKQAAAAGKLLPKDFLCSYGLVYRSPYLRARQTCDILLESAGYRQGYSRQAWDRNVMVYENPSLREVDHGYEDISAQEELRKEHGWFYYRFKGGESPADCYDRCGNFLHSLGRQVERKRKLYENFSENVLIVSHGLTIRCFAMRFMHLTVEQFENLANPKNCDMIRIAKLRQFDQENIEPQLTSGQWGISGLRFRSNPSLTVSGA